MMPQFTTRPYHFSKKIRRSQTISEANCKPNDEKWRDMPPSTEAYGVLNYENNREKWMEIHRISKANGGKNVVYMKDKAAALKSKADRSKNVICDYDTYPKLLPKFTNPNAGQKRYGSWGKVGAQKHLNLRKENEEARKTQESRDLESLVLLALQLCQPKDSPREASPLSKEEIDAADEALVDYYDDLSDEDSDEE